MRQSRSKLRQNIGKRRIKTDRMILQTLGSSSETRRRLANALLAVKTVSFWGENTATGVTLMKSKSKSKRCVLNRWRLKRKIVLNQPFFNNYNYSLFNDFFFVLKCVKVIHYFKTMIKLFFKYIYYILG